MPKKYPLQHSASSVDQAAHCSPLDIEKMCIHVEQQHAVAIIMRCAQGHARRPVVITANRGRGKSAALGIAAALLMQAGKKQLIISALGFAQVQMVFKHAQQLLPDASFDGKCLKWRDACLLFLSTDELLANQAQTQLVLIDEAAMLPVEQLKRIAQRYNRLVFTTTLYGYEGSGSGFEKRFLPFLKKHYKVIKQHHIEQAVRWSVDDKLELFSHELCLLNLDLPVLPDISDVRLLQFEKTESEALFQEASTANRVSALGQIYALLMHAHYRTHPRDLQMLLDAKNVSCFVLRKQQQIYAVVIIKDEGLLDTPMSEQIVAAKRRVTGHLLAQNLLQISGEGQLGGCLCARIMRVVVHPQFQQRGLGSLLMQQLRIYLAKRNYIYWGSSFGLRTELVQFWYKNGLRVFKLGHKRQHSSGEYNSLWIEALDKRYQSMLDDLCDKFMRALPYQLLLNNDYAPELIYALLQGMKSLHARDSAMHTPVAVDLLPIRRYADGELSFEQSFYSLRKFSQQIMQNMHVYSLSKDEGMLLLLLFYYCLERTVVVKRLAYNRSADLQQHLRGIMKKTFNKSLLLLKNPQGLE